jgi:antitoxin component YwqK of YwqJK toxin-antitoxin module
MVKTYYENNEQETLTTYQPFKRSLESYDYDTDSNYRRVREEAVGLPAGQYQNFYPSGSLQEIGNYTAFSNLSYAHYDDQQRVSFKGIKSASTPSDSRVEYYESGSIKYEADVAQFTESRVSYGPTNIKQSEESVLLYTDSGLTKEYWENGNLRSSQTKVTRQYSEYEYHNNGNTSMIYPYVVSLVDGVQLEYYETSELQSETPYEVFTIGGEQRYDNGQLTGETNLAYASVINGEQTQYHKHGQVSATNPYSVYIEPETEQSGNHRYEREVASHKLNGTAWSYTDNTSYPSSGAYIIRQSANYTDGELLSTTEFYSDGTTTTYP